MENIPDWIAQLFILNPGVPSLQGFDICGWRLDKLLNPWKDRKKKIRILRFIGQQSEDWKSNGYPPIFNSWRNCCLSVLAYLVTICRKISLSYSTFRVNTVKRSCSQEMSLKMYKDVIRTILKLPIYVASLISRLVKFNLFFDGNKNRSNSTFQIQEKTLE